MGRAVRRGSGGRGLVPAWLRHRLLPSSARLSDFRFKPEYDHTAAPTIQLEDLRSASRKLFDRSWYVPRWSRHLCAGAALGRVGLLDFPLPTKTDQSGQFITQAEFGQPGLYRVRAGPRLRRDNPTLGCGDQGLTMSGSQPPGPRTASKTTTLARSCVWRRRRCHHTESGAVQHGRSAVNRSGAVLRWRTSMALDPPREAHLQTREISLGTEKRGAS